MEQQTVQDIIAEMPIERQEWINNLPAGDNRDRTFSAFQCIADINNGLVKHGTIILTVEVTTVKGAQQINDWLYSSDKPMESVLSSISWDKTMVSKEVAEKIDALRELFDRGL